MTHPDFIGCIQVRPALNEVERRFLLDLIDSDRTLRGTPTGRGDSDVPFARLAWEICSDGCCLEWNGEEHAKWMLESLRFVVDHLVRPGAKAEGHPKFSGFTFDHVLTGAVMGGSRDLATRLVTVADNGGSSGRLRTEMPVLPPGDLRMALAALCEDSEWGSIWGEVIQHRFATTGDLDGHALGNLLIVALWQILEDPIEALDQMGELLGARGRVLPMALDPLHIEADVREAGDELREPTDERDHLEQDPRVPLDRHVEGRDAAVRAHHLDAHDLLAEGLSAARLHHRVVGDGDEDAEQGHDEVGSARPAAEGRTGADVAAQHGTDEEAEHQLTMYLLDSPTTQESLLETA